MAEKKNPALEADRKALDALRGWIMGLLNAELGQKENEEVGVDASKKAVENIDALVKKNPVGRGIEWMKRQARENPEAW